METSLAKRTGASADRAPWNGSRMRVPRALPRASAPKHTEWDRLTSPRRRTAKMLRRQRRTTSNSAKCSSPRLLKCVRRPRLTRSALQPSCSYYPNPVLTNGQSLEVVLQNINKLNRSLEEVTSVGNEFAPVESLWSHFENVMAKDPNEQAEGTQEGATEHEGETEVPQDRK
jgi:hypothetical protein